MRFLFLLLHIVFFMTSGFGQVFVKNTLSEFLIRNQPLNVNVTICKSESVSDFGRYEMMIPNGYSISLIDQLDAKFTFEKSLAKIVWIKLPSDSCFTFTLKIEPNEKADTLGSIKEKFVYIQHKQREESKLKIKKIKVLETTELYSVKNNNQTLNAEPLLNNITKNYRLQLGAFKLKQTEQQYSHLGKVTIENINGYYKVFYGSFSSEEDAWKSLQLLRKRGIDAFVVQYKK